MNALLQFLEILKLRSVFSLLDSFKALLLEYCLCKCLLMKVVSEKQRKEAAPPVTPLVHASDKTKYFLAEVCEG